MTAVGSLTRKMSEHGLETIESLWSQVSSAKDVPGTMTCDNRMHKATIQTRIRKG